MRLINTGYIIIYKLLQGDILGFGEEEKKKNNHINYCYYYYYYYYYYYFDIGVRAGHCCE